LIVDDNLGFLHAARALLEEENIRVVGIASTPEEALRLATDLCPDVTLLDIDLGRDNGFDLAQRLADDPRVEPGRLILISSYSGEEFADLIDASPAIGFVKKPMLSGEAIDRLVRAADDANPRRGEVPEP